MEAVYILGFLLVYGLLALLINRGPRPLDVVDLAVVSGGLLVLTLVVEKAS